MRRTLPHLLTLAALALLAAATAPESRATTASTGKPAAKAAPVAPTAARLDTATFAMGCFWCGETQFTQQPGVLSVTSGYTGGKKQHPTY